MKHISDENIYLYVINRELLGTEELRNTVRHLSECSECREFAEMTRSFLKEYDNIGNLGLDSELRHSNFRIVRQGRTVGRSEVPESDLSLFKLKPLRIYDDTPAQFSKLAAEQKPEDLDRFRHILTYASAHKFVLLRVLYNPAKKEYDLYLVCDDMSKVGNALINFEGEEAEYVADNNGIVKLNRDFISENVNVYIHLPISQFEIDINQVLRGDKCLEITSKEKITLKLLKLNGEVKAVMNFAREFGPGRLKAIVLFGDNFEKHYSCDIHEGTFSFPRTGLNKVKIVLVQKQ